MKCSKIHKLTSAYIDGELNARDKEAFESHVKSCGACGTAVEETKSQRSLFAHAQQFKAPYGFSTKVMANIAPEKADGISWAPIFTRFAGAVVLLMIIFTGIISGGFLAGQLMPDKFSATARSLSLDIFDPAPPDSLGGVYLAMTEVGNEK
ncbi:MAG: hypothetical protein EPN22_14310 [Nitrospirae bacterium]|nr:MAG: hypothetical protein EPN22_14310 [Nitrospirota bacterium]